MGKTLFYTCHKLSRRWQHWVVYCPTRQAEIGQKQTEERVQIVPFLGSEPGSLLLLLDEPEARKTRLDAQLLNGFDALLSPDFFDYAKSAVILVAGEDG